MPEQYKLEFLDIVTILVRRKILILSVFFTSLIVSYIAIRLFIEEEYTASATIMPTEESEMAGLFALANQFSDFLPAGLGNIDKESAMDLFNVIIYSRTNIEHLIDKYGLWELYKFKKKDLALKQVRKMITTKITLQNAFTISGQFRTPEMAAEITNHIVQRVNDQVVALNVAKAKDNRLFIQKRYAEIEEKLKLAEDSMRVFMAQRKMFEAKVQTKATLEALAKMESELALKEMEHNIAKRIYGEKSTNSTHAKVAVNELRKSLGKLKRGGGKNSIIVGIDSLSQVMIAYFRHYRDVEMYTKMLEFIVPMYEQARYEEQKKIPILQIIDHAVPPEKKSYPRRTLTAGFIAGFLTMALMSFIVFRTLLVNTQNPKLKFIIDELFRFRKA